MGRRTADIVLCGKVAKELGVSARDVGSIVCSFFNHIYREANKMPFDNNRRIYTEDGFGRFETVHNIPCIGRLGTSYSRYLKWRANEAASVIQVKRPKKGKHYTEEDIELLADAILTGKPLPELKKKTTSEMYNRVWLVGKNGKKLARQVIPKQENNVQD